MNPILRFCGVWCAAPKDDGGSSAHEQKPLVGDESGPGGQGDLKSPEEYEAALVSLKLKISETNKEAASYRTQLREAQAKLEKLEGAGAKDVEELKQQIDAMQTRAKEAQERAVEDEIKASAAALGAVDPGDVLKLIDRSQLVIEEGRMTNVKEIVEEFLRAKPHLTKARSRIDAGAGGESGSQLDMNSLIRQQAGR